MKPVVIVPFRTAPYKCPQGCDVELRRFQQPSRNQNERLFVARGECKHVVVLVTVKETR